MREGTFDLATPGKNLLNTDCRIYKEIGKSRTSCERTNRHGSAARICVKFAKRGSFWQPFGNDYTLAFSRILNPSEILVAYDISSNAGYQGMR